MTETSKIVEYAERGAGPAVLFVPGSFGTGAGWRAIIDKLGDGYRCVTTSLLGYGATAERRTAANTTIDLELDALDAVIDRIAAPVHIVGHSYGGLCTLALAVRRKRDIRSLTLIEANPLDVLRQAGEDDHYRSFTAMTDVYFRAFAAGDSEAARCVIDFYGGAGSFDAFPQKVRDYVIATTATNVLDWQTGYAFNAPLAEYTSITAPTLLIRGLIGHPAMLRIAEILQANMRHVSLESIPDGRHFLPATHASQMAEHIRRHVDANTNC
jgi:pimeloyl-ACP methyl ester carboxylesterase